MKIGLSAKTLFDNFKPIVVYWAVLAVCMLAVVLGDLSTAYWAIPAVVIMCLFNLIIGYTNGIKTLKWGIACLGIQLAACALLYSIFDYGRFAQSSITAFGNIAFSNIFYCEKMLFAIYFARHCPFYC